MNSFSKYPSWVERLVATIMLLQFAPPVEANPSAPVVARGGATFSSQGSQYTVQTSGNALINWGSFNIGLGETTRFIEPSASSVVWNHINDANPSQILGHLDANGYVILQNQSGFYVGGQAAITTAGLLMTTAPTVPLDISGGGAWSFNAPPPTASIINYGQIYAGAGAPVFLIAHDIENHGSITAPGGSIGLYAGKEVMVSSRPDGRGLSAQVSLPEGSVDNSGKLIADAGTIALHAQVVNQGGLIQANSVREQNGVIEIVAGDSLTLQSSSVIRANGDAQAVSAGGQVTLHSANTFSDQAGSSISVAGGGPGGAGGVVEVSAPNLPAIHSAIDGQASAGSTGGRLLIDPTIINLNGTGTGSAGTGTVNAGDPPGTLNLNINSAFSGFSQIDLQASQDINLAANTIWELPSSTHVSGSGLQLVLEAGNNINLANGSSLLADGGWNITLEAGRNFSVANTVVPGAPNTAATGTINAGTGNITLAGNATVQAQSGSISLVAGNNITVHTGAIRTMGGGNVDVEALSGNVNSGNNPSAYTFRLGTISPLLGGISTAAGGNVNISAGGDVTSFLPTAVGTSVSDAGSGAFGPEPGIVTVTAGGNVYGHFVAADSVTLDKTTLKYVDAASTITALNGNAGAAGNLLALSLAIGGWQVNAPKGSIYLQEVRNPNGALNGTSTANKHVFTYDLNSFVDLEAPKGGVYLEGTLLPRYTSDQVPIIFPPTLTINSGSGGVTLGNNVILFPSPDGELDLNTTGSLEGNGFGLTMSDSGKTRWVGTDNPPDFSAADHAATPVQLNNPNPVVFNIGGNCDDITISTPKETQITVGGEMDNTSFVGQNLHPYVDAKHPGDVTFIHVAGRIFNQNTYSFSDLNSVTLPKPVALYPGGPADYLQVLENAVVPGSGPSTVNAGLLFPPSLSSLFYLSGTGQLGFYGKMDPTLEGLLLQGTFQEKTYLLNGQPLLDANGAYVTKTVAFPVSASLITALYTASQNSIDPATAPTGFLIGGPGLLDISAQSLDLGVSGGINSVGPADNPALVKVGSVGADININLTGDLTLFASQISSQYKGSIYINAGGAINAGLQDLPLSTPFVPHGIWTSGKNSDVTVIAAGNINVAGSRIAAFDGGNITVESTLGNVNAGTGDFSEVKVNEVLVDPVTHEVTTPQQPIAGSGILATTLPDAPANLQVGNITVTTPRGNISASEGGIVQEPLNGNTSLIPTLSLTAGTRNKDGSILYAGNIDSGSSGVIGINTSENAAGNISGLVIARGDATLNAAKDVNGTVLAGGTATLGAGGSIGGIVMAGSGIAIGSGSFQGEAMAQNVSGGGAQSVLASSSTASSSSQTAAAQSSNDQKAQTTLAPADDDGKKHVKHPLLAKYIGRVTVLLPKTLRN